MTRGIAADVAAMLAAVLATGCFSIPPYQPDVAVSYTEAGDGATVAGPDFKLHFAGGDSFHFPDQLLVGDVDVMAYTPSKAPACFEESQAGFLISPTSRISADTDAARVTNRLVPVLRGPAIVQVKLEWATRLACNTAHSPGGTSTFTIFPDGRIVRNDTLIDTSSSEANASLCSCSTTDTPPSGFVVAPYWTLARAPFSNLYALDTLSRPDTPAPIPLSTFTTEIDNNVAGCLDNGMYQVAFAWYAPFDHADTTIIRGTADTIGLDRDLVFGLPMLPSLMREVSSALFTTNHGCMKALGRAREHASPSGLVIDGSGTPIQPSTRDGIYGGADDNGQTGIALMADRVELTGPVNSSFAVWLRFPHAVDAVHAKLEGASGPWYVPQRVDDRSWIVWFRDAIAAAQTITIEAN